jgi:ribonuclease T2
MIWMRRCLSVLLVVIVGFAGVVGTVDARRSKKVKVKPFDFYVLSLSWSPDYCNGHSQDQQQCAIGKKYGFVLHGLWPQFNTGYPQNCTTEHLLQEIKAQFADLYPSPKLFDHEWSKHGTCSGLKPVEYLTLSKQIKNSVVIPPAYVAPTKPFRVTIDQLVQEFVAANTVLGLPKESLAVNCSGTRAESFLTELRVCFAREGGKPIACSQEVLKQAAKSCRKDDFLVRNVR